MLYWLLERERENQLTEVEVCELDEYARIEHQMVMIKAGNLSYLTLAP